VIVIDASALAAFLRKEQGWKNLAKHIRNSVTVYLALKEVANALWKDYYVKKRLDKDVVESLYKLMKKLANVNVILESETKYLDEAFRIALENGITVYDALYISLAKARNLQLLTLDRKQREIAEKLGIKTIKTL